MVFISSNKSSKLSSPNNDDGKLINKYCKVLDNKSISLYLVFRSSNDIFSYNKSLHNTCFTRTLVLSLRNIPEYI